MSTKAEADRLRSVRETAQGVRQAQPKGQEETKLLSMLQTVLTTIGSTPQIKGDQGERGLMGPKPQKGIDYIDGQDGYTPQKGIDYFDGKDGKDGMDGKNGLDGKDGKDGTANLSDVKKVAENVVKKHEKDANHDPFVLGTKWINEEGMEVGMFVQYKGDNELVYAHMKQVAQQLSPYMRYGGSTGDVIGPASAVNADIALFDTTTGKLIKDSGFGIAISSTASAAVARDANKNAFASNFVSGLSNVGSTGGTTTLTAASFRSQNLTGSSTHTFQLPAATTLTVGTVFEFFNSSTGVLTIKDGAGSTLTTVASSGRTTMEVAVAATTAGTWLVTPFGNVSGPASATDTAIVVYNGTTGKIIKNTTATIDGSGDLSMGSHNITNVVTLSGGTLKLSDGSHTSIDVAGRSINDTATGAIMLEWNTNPGFLNNHVDFYMNGNDLINAGDVSLQSLTPVGSTITVNGEINIQNYAFDAGGGDFRFAGTHVIFSSGAYIYDNGGVQLSIDPDIRTLNSGSLGGKTIIDYSGTGSNSNANISFDSGSSYFSGAIVFATGYSITGSGNAIYFNGGSGNEYLAYQSQIITDYNSLSNIPMSGSGDVYTNISFNAFSITDGSHNPSITPNNRTLTASDGSTPMLVWETPGALNMPSLPTSPSGLSTGDLFYTDAATAVTNNYNVVCIV